MAFPSVAGTPTGTSDTTSASFTVTLPSGIVAGELLLLFMAHDGTGTISQTSGGFTQIDTGGNGTACQGEIWAKIAAGGDANPVFSSTNSQDVAIVAIRVQGHSVSNVSTDITKGTAAIGSGASPDPPNCNPGTANDYLWLEHFAADDDDNTATYQSTNYTQVLQQESAQSTTSCMSTVASRQLNAASEDPGVMAMAAVEEWRAQTIAIPPSAVQTVTPSPVTFASSVVAPVVVAGAVALTPAPALASFAVAAVTLIAGAVSVTPTPTASATAVPTPNVSNVTTLTPSPVASAFGVAAPTLVPGVATLTPSPTASAWGVATPTVVAGQVTLTPSPATSTWGAATPSIVAGTVTLTPSPTSASWSVAASTLVAGAVTVSPSPATAAWSVATPVIQAGAVTLTPSPASAAYSVPTPTVSTSGGGQTVTPTPASAAWSVATPTVTAGTVTLTPSAVVAAWSVATPTVTGGYGLISQVSSFTVNVDRSEAMTVNVDRSEAMTVNL